MASADAGLALHPDRLLPPDPAERNIARRLYERVRRLPLICPHGHVDPQVLLNNEPFADPAILFVTPDHYVTRLLHADGVGLDALGVGQGELSEEVARQAWRLLCERWSIFQGMPVRYWLEAELAEIFDVTLQPSAKTADVIYDDVARCLADDAYRPRALYQQFDIAVLATTDDPAS
ncbi:MAG: uxaC, partial [Mycobacterium sp.]|nr:uxaC [Mycobacterium sp.]